MNLDCVNCKGKCCKTGLSFSAVMTREESQELQNMVENTPDLRLQSFCHFDEKARAYRVNKCTDNLCVFFEHEKLSCNAYDSRPLDCRIFPLEYRWFRWMYSPDCPSKNFDKKALLAQLKDYTPREVRALKLMHIRTPESTKDKLWILLTKYLPIGASYELYTKLRDFFAIRKNLSADYVE